MSRIFENLESVQTRIAKACSESSTPRLIAVSKTRPIEDIRAAAEAGQRDFGENYLQEAVEKNSALQDLSLCWHFIGHLQSNKTAAVAAHFDWVHTVDRLKIAQRLSEQRAPEKPLLNLLLQVNIDDEASKSGCSPAELPALAAAVSNLQQVRLRGIMAIPAPRDAFEDQLEVCRQVFALYEDLKQQQPEIDTLSLGMSADLEAAITAGSTMVRVGTDIFGQRVQTQK